MSTWRQTGPSRWIIGTIHPHPELDDDTILDRFNTECQAALGNPAVTVTDVDQFYTVKVDHDVWEIEAAVTIGRRYDHPALLAEGLDT